MAGWRRGRGIARSVPVALGLLAACSCSERAAAQVGSARYASIVVEAGSGRVLEEESPDGLRHPASLAKLMTLYLTFEALRDRRFSLGQPVPVSEHAASMQPSKLGLVQGSRLTVDEAILGLVTKSANDSATALGELLAGTEQRFAQMMTLRARSLGMVNTTFTNASGLPDPNQWSTARDLALLARRLISDFPEHYHYFSTPSFFFHRQVVFNHDTMIKRYPGADGLKTGYTEASGHNLVTSAVRGGVLLIGVELGCASNGERDAHMAALLNAAYAELSIPIVGPEVRTARGGLISQARASETSVRPELRLRTVANGRHAEPIGWRIQVGNFATRRAAQLAAERARQLTMGGEVRVERAALHGRGNWRAIVIGLSANGATGACTTLARHKASCFVLRPEARQMAAL